MDNNMLKNNFIDLFGGDENEIRLFRSPGRVNLIGEHTDYNGGYVLPAAIDMYTTIACRSRSDRIMRLAATDLKGIVTAELDMLQNYKNISWGNYQLGVADEMMKAGYDITGCDMLFHDTIPHGTGLSSSAAIEVATAVALYALSASSGNVSGVKAKNKPDMVELAKICQKAENNFVGVNCGIMDQFASAMGRKGKAIFLNCCDLSFELVPIELEGHSIIISNTNKKRSLTTSKYNERRQECEEGLKQLKQAFPDINFLGEINTDMFNEGKRLILNDVVRKRCEHVVYEDDRVLKSVEALKNHDLKAFGKLMIASHDSLRDLYEVTGNELDAMVEEALKINGVIGSRMTGAGFGGCTVSIVQNEAIKDFTDTVGRNYRDRVGIVPTFHIAGIGEGGSELFD